MFNPELLTTLTTEISNPEPVLIDAYDFTTQICTSNQTAKQRKQAREAIAKAATYRRIYREMFPNMVSFLRNEFYKGKPQAEDESFIVSAARDIVREQSQQMVYEWEQYEPFESFSNAEVRAVLYGMEIA